MGHKLTIAIAGAGIGGLAAAALLAREGHRVTVFDRFSAPSPVGSGLMLQETGLAVLDTIGLRQPIEALGARIERLHGRSFPSGRTVLDVRFKALSDDVAGLGVQRSALFNLLLHIALSEGAELEADTHIRAADPTGTRLVTRAGRMLGPFDLVVDALGVRSPLSSRPHRDLPYGALWTTLPWPEGDTLDATALEQRYQRASRMAGVMASGQIAPGAGRKATYFWSLRRGTYNAFRVASLDRWKEDALRLWPETERLLDQITDHDQFAFARYRHRTHKSPVDGRLVYVGDSWHAASPQLGQGANMALLDAYALALALARVPLLGDALAHYAYLRSGHVRLYQAMTWAFTPVYQSDSLVLPWLRDVLAAPVSRMPPAPRILAAMVSGAIGRPLKRLGLAH